LGYDCRSVFGRATQRDSVLASVAEGVEAGVDQGAVDTGGG